MIDIIVVSTIVAIASVFGIRYIFNSLTIESRGHSCSGNCANCSCSVYLNTKQHEETSA